MAVDLYTSLKRLKMSMNGGQMPAMTPLTDKAKKFIDPDLTIGMGALVEDENKGLRCPVRGCGEWHHLLTRHLNHGHRGIGGADGIRLALEIPRGASFASSRLRASLSARAGNGSQLRGTAQWTAERREVARVSRRLTIRSAGRRNLRNMCDAQIAHKIIDLEHKLGHSPSMTEAMAVYGRAFQYWVTLAYGSWNNAKAQLGMKTMTMGHTPDDIYDGFREYHKVHGRLPTSYEATRTTRFPLTPSMKATFYALNVSSWKLAMQQVAFVLGVEDPRYSVVAA